MWEEFVRTRSAKVTYDVAHRGKASCLFLLSVSVCASGVTAMSHSKQSHKRENLPLHNLRWLFLKKNHMKKHYTLINENEGMPCKKCNKTFLNVPKLNQHIRNVHAEKTFHCPQCDEPFSSAANLYSRQIMHFNETPFACAICEKTFKRRQHLKSHQIDHKTIHEKGLTLVQALRSRVGAKGCWRIFF